MFKAVFEVPAWRGACEAAAGGIKASLKTYKEVLDHLSEGLRFYMSLQVWHMWQDTRTGGRVLLIDAHEHAGSTISIECE